jgi:hypothetical protein
MRYVIPLKGKQTATWSEEFLNKKSVLVNEEVAHGK